MLDTPDVKVTLLERYDGREARVGDRVILSAGGPVVWFVYPRLCRDVGRFHLADGTFTGWYTNLRAPIRMDGDDWYCTDLFLDHWMPADGGSGTWLDEDELDRAVAGSLLSAAEVHLVRTERAALEVELNAGRWPLPVASRIDLPGARRALGTSGPGASA